MDRRTLLAFKASPNKAKEVCSALFFYIIEQFDSGVQFFS